MELTIFSKVISVKEEIRRIHERETEVNYYYAVGDGTITIETDTGIYKLGVETHIAKAGIYTVSDISGPQFDKASLDILIPALWDSADETMGSNGFLIGLIQHLPVDDIKEVLTDNDQEYLIKYLAELFPEKA